MGLLVILCEIDTLVYGMFGFFGLLTSYIIYKHVKKQEDINDAKKFESVLQKASLKDTI
jgi:hypothetical protein